MPVPDGVLFSLVLFIAVSSRLLSKEVISSDVISSEVLSGALDEYCIIMLGSAVLIISSEETVEKMEVFSKVEVVESVEVIETDVTIVSSIGVDTPRRSFPKLIPSEVSESVAVVGVSITTDVVVLVVITVNSSDEIEELVKVSWPGSEALSVDEISAFNVLVLKSLSIVNSANDSEALLFVMTISVSAVILDTDDGVTDKSPVDSTGKSVVAVELGSASP